MSSGPVEDLAAVDRLLVPLGSALESARDERDPVPALLREELTVDAAIRVAVLRNRGLGARLAEVGLARADLIEALTPENPQVEGSARFPDTSPRRTNFDFSATQDLISLVLMPLRTRVAEARLERERLEAADEVLRLSRDTEAAYYELQGSLLAKAVLEAFSEAAWASYEFARSLKEAGNINALNLANQEVLAQQARLDLARVEAEVLQLRERLNRLLGLWGAEAAGWSLPATLPELPPVEAALARLESTAVDRRLDLAALRQEVTALTYERDRARTQRWLPALSVGVSGERGSEGGWQLGPALSLSLPLFDRRQGELARLGAQSDAAQERFADLAVAIRAEVRASRARLLAAREIAVHLRDTLVPLRERIVRLTQEQYNFMLVGAFQLLDAKQNQLATYRDYAESVRDYWLAHNELRRAIGGSLPSAGE